MTQVFYESIDFAWQQISPKEMLAAGYRGGSFRYISHDGSKDITSIEIENDHGAGLPVFPMYESTAGRSRDGKQAGIDDGNFHNDRLVHLGFPITTARCTTTDFDGGDECIPYYEGWAEANRELRRASYGSGYLCRRLKQLGLIDIGWQTLSMGFRESTPVNHAYVDVLQRFPTRSMGSHPRNTWDENEIYIPDWGAWYPPGWTSSDEEEEPMNVRPEDGTVIIPLKGKAGRLLLSCDQPSLVRLAFGKNGKVEYISPHDAEQVGHITQVPHSLVDATWASLRVYAAGAKDASGNVVSNATGNPVGVTVDYA